MFVMFLGGMAIDTDIIMDGYDALKIVSDLINGHFKDVLPHLQSKGHVQELVPSLVGDGSGEVRAILIKVHTSEAIFTSSFKTVLAPLR